MSTITFQIKLINRAKLNLLPALYEKSQKLPRHLRGSEFDHLNVFSKTVNIQRDHLANDYWSTELALLAAHILPFRLSINPSFGDKLVGCFTTREFDDFYIEIYQHYKWIVY